MSVFLAALVPVVALLCLVPSPVASFDLLRSIWDHSDFSGLLEVRSWEEFSHLNKDFGPGGCAACTVGVGVLKRILEYQQYPLEKFLDALCKELPPKYAKTCQVLVDVFEPIIVELLEAEVGPDNICRRIFFCKHYKQCQLYPKDFAFETEAGSSVPPPVSPRNHHSPVPPQENDEDGDHFSTYMYKRGTTWRGRDCDDNDKNVYPGRKHSPTPTNTSLDYNCNGIYGVDAASGRQWEDVLCSDSPEAISSRRGLAAIGDSACAHFHIPPFYLQPNVTLASLRWIMPLVLNEFDWPHLSMYGGFMHDITGLTPGKVDSIYMKMKEKNRCNHRDYQTLCVNGCSSGDTGDEVNVLTRLTTDHPLVTFISLFGDDVCKNNVCLRRCGDFLLTFCPRQQQGFQYMTTPEKFRSNLVWTLDLLDTTLPPNSHVVFASLVDGELIYQFLGHRLHPLGIPYARVYDFLNCLKRPGTVRGINPCWGWLNSDAKVRNETQRHADALCDVFPKIIRDLSSKYSFKMHFIDSRATMFKIMKQHVKEGGHPYELVEPVDGFHPSQVFLPLFAEDVWNQLEAEDPTIFGSSNPKNSEIESLFGNQGGY